MAVAFERSRTMSIWWCGTLSTGREAADYVMKLAVQCLQRAPLLASVVDDNGKVAVG